MVNLSNLINSNTFIISDTHFGHHNILQYEPVRVEYLSDYDQDATEQCQHLLDLFDFIPKEQQFQHEEIKFICKELIHSHDKMLQEKWNSVVGENDTVLHLGDFAFKNIEEYTKKLNGNKIILRGNHDLKHGNHYIESGWKDIIESVKMNINGNIFELQPNVDKYWNGFLTVINDTRIMFTHYPLFNSNDWDLKKYGHITKMLENIYTGYDAQVNIHGHIHSKKSDFKNAINVSTEKCPGLRPITIGELLQLNTF
jgi:calcineurin-like phosphoesterase family protein